MTEMTATQAQRQFGALLDEASQGPVEITKQGRRTHVVLSDLQYRQLREKQSSELFKLMDAMGEAVAKSGHSEEEVRRMIAEEIQAVRAERRSR